jgi:hypothetical protein
MIITLFSGSLERRRAVVRPETPALQLGEPLSVKVRDNEKIDKPDHHDIWHSEEFGRLASNNLGSVKERIETPRTSKSRKRNMP